MKSPSNEGLFYAKNSYLFLIINQLQCRNLCLLIIWQILEKKSVILLCIWCSISFISPERFEKTVDCSLVIVYWRHFYFFL